MTQFTLEVFETATGKLVWEGVYDTAEQVQDEMDSWDCNEYEFNFETILIPV
jgi:hypothetical protein